MSRRPRRNHASAFNQDPQLTRVFSTFSANNPSIYLDIDRNKVTHWPGCSGSRYSVALPDTRM